MGTSININKINNKSILLAMKYFDEKGRFSVLKEYGFGPSKKHFLFFDNKIYDTKCLLSVAHDFQYGQQLNADEFSGGITTTQVMRKFCNAFPKKAFLTEDHKKSKLKARTVLNIKGDFEKIDYHTPLKSIGFSDWMQISILDSIDFGVLPGVYAVLPL